MASSTQAALPASLVLVGAGRMGGALLEGWLAHGLDAAGATVLDPKPAPEIKVLCARCGIALNPQAPTPPEAVVLAIKPQGLDEAAPAVGRLLGPDTLLVSILAGKTVRDLRRRLPPARAVVRAMPNLPASIGRGATGAFANSEVSERQKAMAHALLSSVGLVEWLASEALLDAVTAVSGSGPAYVFLLAECLAKAGADAGLPPDLAGRLARATVTGAAALLAESDLPPDALRRNVTSPGGTTAAALDVLMGAGGLEPLMRAAVAAAKRRGEELSG
jgi:pyrroline-5-carboxylate reductase